MPARVINTYAPVPVRLWRAVQCAYLRWRIADIEQQARWADLDPHQPAAQAALYRQCAQALRVRLTLKENS